MEPVNPIYNIDHYTEIRGAIDPVLFEAALQQVLVEAEALRVQIFKGTDGPGQFVNNSLKWSMPLIDVSAELNP